MTPIFDIHTHILPEMDDGSENPAMTHELVEMLRKQGITQLCATPHFYPWRENIENFLQRRDKAVRQACDAVQDLLPMLHLGAEVAYERDISRWDDLDRLCMDDTKTLLLEMPFQTWTNSQLEEVIHLVLDLEYTVILAHPERYYFGKNSEYMERLSVLPIGFQVNADSIINWRTRKYALELLQMTRYPLLGSDCHNSYVRSPHMDKARNVIQKKLGTEFLTKIDETASTLILARTKR